MIVEIEPLGADSVEIASTEVSLRSVEKEVVPAGPVGPGGLASFTEDFTATESLGGLDQGTVFEEGDRLEDAIIQMFFEYVEPSLSFSYSQANTVETGVTQDGSLDVGYAAGDGGDVDSIDMTRDGSSISLQNAPSTPASGDFLFSEPVSEQLTVPGTVDFSVDIHYLEGTEQHGIPDPPGPGTKNGSATLQWKYRYWASSDQINSGFDLSGSVNSADVRGLPTGGSTGAGGLGVGGQVYLSDVSGQDSLELAVQNGKTLDSVDVQVGTVAGSIDVSDFVQKTVSVQLPDGSTTKDYNVYQYVPDSEFDDSNQVQIWFNLS